jgi:hypothetical protein
VLVRECLCEQFGCHLPERLAAAFLTLAQLAQHRVVDVERRPHDAPMP